MSDEKMRDHLVNAMKTRALFYYAFYKGVQRRNRTRENQGTHEARRLQAWTGDRETVREICPSDFAGLKDAFLGFIPDPTGAFNPELESCSAAGIDIQLTTCPLRDAWQEAGLSDEEVAIMTDIAGAVDAGTFEGAGFSFEPDTWKPGRRGCCHLQIRPREKGK